MMLLACTMGIHKLQSTETKNECTDKPQSRPEVAV
jgi:hypothetical protein